MVAPFTDGYKLNTLFNLICLMTGGV